jgi:hypothetical protein
VAGAGLVFCGSFRQITDVRYCVATEGLVFSFVAVVGKKQMLGVVW